MDKKLFECRNCGFATEHNDKCIDGFCEACCGVLNSNPGVGNRLVEGVVPGVIVNLIKKHIDKKFTEDQIRDMTIDELTEEFADLAHQSWSGWMKYLVSKCESSLGSIKMADALIIPGWAIERWTRQMNTDYKDLPEDEKESDRKEARIYLGAIFRADAKRRQ